jgi:hypothetical protein
MAHTIDVSAVVTLRRRISDAQFSIKVAGLLSGLKLGTSLFPWLGWAATILVPVVVGWSCWRLARHFGKGGSASIQLVTVAFIPYACWCLYVLAGFFANPTIYLINLIVVAVYTITAYKIPLGLLAALRMRRTDPRQAALQGLVSVWQRSANRNQPGTFPAKGRFRLYVYLALLPFPTVFWLVITFAVPSQPVRPDVTPKDVSRQIGAIIAQSLCGFVLVVPASVFLYRRARKHAAREAIDVAARDKRPIILYLRWFEDDNVTMRARRAHGRSWLDTIYKIGFEEVVADHLFQYGPVVAIGRPDDKVPSLGASRDYLDEGAWQDRVDHLIREARAIVMTADFSSGLMWELGKIVELDVTRKLIVIAPPIPTDQLAIRWEHFMKRVVALGGVSATIDVDHTRAVLFPAGRPPVAITSDRKDDWSYEVSLDAAMEMLGNEDVTIRALLDGTEIEGRAPDGGGN